MFYFYFYLYLYFYLCFLFYYYHYYHYDLPNDFIHLFFHLLESFKKNKNKNTKGSRGLWVRKALWGFSNHITANHRHRRMSPLSTTKAMHHV